MIASGGVQGYEPAARMAKTRWNQELADLAALNVIQCDGEHDTCRNTEAFPYGGQNVAVIYYRGLFDSNKVCLDQIDNWFNERLHCSMNEIRAYKDPTDGYANDIYSLTSFRSYPKFILIRCYRF